MYNSIPASKFNIQGFAKMKKQTMFMLNDSMEEYIKHSGMKFQVCEKYKIVSGKAMEIIKTPLKY